MYEEEVKDYSLQHIYFDVIYEVSLELILGKNWPFVLYRCATGSVTLREECDWIEGTC
jgi:hypothetical protein